MVQEWISQRISVIIMLNNPLFDAITPTLTLETGN